MPGCVGLNNLKLTDFANSVLQLLARVQPLRDACLLSADETDSSKPASSTSSIDPKTLLSNHFSKLLKKLWNPFNFKGHVSPHEFMEAVSVASGKRFRCDDRQRSENQFGGQADPLQFLAWLLNSLKLHRKVIEKTFQGELEVTKMVKQNSSASDECYDMDKKTVKFFFLSLDVPSHPLFKEQQELSTLPTVPLTQLLKKYDGHSVTETTEKQSNGAELGVKTRYSVKKLPSFLFIHVKRFSKNNFFREKNQTIVNFPIRGLDLSEMLQEQSGSGESILYDLVGTLVHTGKAESGFYKVMAVHEASGQWHDIQDLLVNEIMPQQVTVSESYILLFKRRQRA